MLRRQSNKTFYLPTYIIYIYDNNMNILPRLLHWYFSRSALPYWCILLLDYILIIFSGFLCYYLFNNGEMLVNNIWPITRDILVLLGNL